MPDPSFAPFTSQHGITLVAGIGAIAVLLILGRRGGRTELVTRAVLAFICLTSTMFGSWTWSQVERASAFHDMMEQLEIAYGPSQAVDIQSYKLWREALVAQPIIAVAAALEPVSPLGGTITFPGQTDWNYVIHHSTNLCEWREIERERAVQDGPMNCPVDFTGTRGFWRVQRFQDLPEDP